MRLSLLFSLLLLFFSSLAFADTHSIESLPVQDAGRVKPLVTLAQETLQLIHGKSKYEGKPALHILTTWLLVPEPWMEKEIIKIDHHGLKKALGFPKEKKYFTPEEIGSHPRLNVLFSDLQVRSARKEKLNAYYQAIQRLQSQLLTFYGITQGSLRVFPPGKDEDRSAWYSLRDMQEEDSEVFFKLLAAYSTQFVGSSDDSVTRGEANLKAALSEFTQKAKAKGGEKYPSYSEMWTEVHYQKLKPFFWTWILYLLSTLVFAFSFLIFQTSLTWLGSALFTGAFALHTYGFALRCIITGRPPVSNMYETVVWVGWGVVLFAALFAFMRKKTWVALVGAAVATVCMITADFAPVILDSTLQPLEPVLRSNLWLTIHVMTITLSYAAFFLAFGIGDYGVFLYVKDKVANKAKIRELAQVAYRCIQIGVVLLTAGTILGGVWADYSWGRFWGWDPKETWAFIALMGYLALLHARLVGWAKDFGMLAGSIVSFSLVIMAWYGVNFVLGAGLHSYGFGAGGIEYVSGFVGLHIIFVGYAWLVNREPLTLSET
jgi:cytochrome c-type biogenesis protein CcsB